MEPRQRGETRYISPDGEMYTWDSYFRAVKKIAEEKYNVRNVELAEVDVLFNEAVTIENAALYISNYEGIYEKGYWLYQWCELTQDYGSLKQKEICLIVDIFHNGREQIRVWFPARSREIDTPGMMSGGYKAILIENVEAYLKKIDVIVTSKAGPS